MYGDETLERVLYYAPASVGFGHQARIRDPRRAFENTSSFLADFTVHKLAREISLTLSEPNDMTSIVSSPKALDSARHIFGPETRSSSRAKDWALRADQLQPALEFAVECNTSKVKQLWPVLLSFSYNFLWRDLLADPVSVESSEFEQVCRNNLSMLNILVLDKILFLQPILTFPFPWDSPEAVPYLERIGPRAPFRFREQYFKRQLPSKKGGYSRSLNLKKGWMHPNQTL